MRFIRGNMKFKIVRTTITRDSHKDKYDILGGRRFGRQKDLSREALIGYIAFLFTELLDENSDANLDFQLKLED